MKDDNEKFWLGEDWSMGEVAINHMQTTDGDWYETEDGLQLDGNYSEWSVRVYHPRTRSLSWLHKTIAILPKSQLRALHKLIGEYLGNNKET